MHIQRPPPLYIWYASPEQTKQNQYQETLEAVGDKSERIKKVMKVNVNKHRMGRGLQDERDGGRMVV